MTREDARLRYFTIPGTEPEKAQHRSARQATTHKRAFAMLSLDQTLLGQQFHGPAQGSQREVPKPSSFRLAARCPAATRR